MMTTNIRQRVEEFHILFEPDLNYKTWYEFKKDLESLCGQPILNNEWLRIKPQNALPWSSSNLRASYMAKESLK
jgi:hypothetical protein